MKRSYTHRITATLLLMVFLVGNTPKSAFHFAFASHKDDTTCNADGETIRLAVKTCDILDLVCSLPFQPDHLVITFNTNEHFPPHSAETISRVIPGISGNPLLRGPPADRSV